VHVRAALSEHGAPDRDRGIHVAVIAEVADRAAVQPATLPFRGGDELHRPHLWRAGQCARGEDSTKGIERVEVRPELALDV
jgi:hypothetical protein